MTTILPRRGTAAEWTTADPVLRDGEMGIDPNTGDDQTRRWCDSVEQPTRTQRR